MTTLPLDQVLIGDALDLMRTLPDRSVNAVITSPPYSGKRDYLTATWIGGEAACDHVPDAEIQSRYGGAASAVQRTNRGVTFAQYRDVCGKCGATRRDQQIGLEKTPEAYIERLAALFGEAYRVVRDDGVLWINIDSSYASAKSRYSSRGQSIRSQQIRPAYGEPMEGQKPDLRGSGWRDGELIPIPYMLAMALRQHGWILRADVIWHKPNGMPESVADRPTHAHEHLLMFVKCKGYYFNVAVISTPQKAVSIARERRAVSGDHKLAEGAPGQPMQSRHKPRPNRVGSADASDAAHLARPRDVLTLATRKESDVHYATFPRQLARWMLIAACPPGGVVLVRSWDRARRAWWRVKRGGITSASS